MKKKKKISVRVLSALLTLCLMLSVVFSAPVAVTATEAETETGVKVLDVAIPNNTVDSYNGLEEVKRTPIRRLYEEEGDDLNKTVWLNDDGTRTMTIYDYPVKFVNASGQIQDISLDVAEATDGSGAFKTAAGWANTVFPSRITDGVTLSGNGEELKLTPVMPQGSLVASAERSNKLVAKDKVSRKDGKTVSYNYDTKTNIEYSLTYTGFKEDIVVNEYTGQTEYSFLLETNGLTLVNNNGSYHLEDAKGNTKASVGDVIIFTADERNNTMGYMTHTTVKANHSYLLTIHVDADWLKDEKTVYPIRIDPTLEMTDTEKLVEDVTIYSGGAVNPTSTILCVGNREDLGVCRTLMKFPNLDLSDISKSVNVVSAGIKLYDLYKQAEPMGVYCYIYDGNDWEDNTATWGNNANGYTHFMSHNDVSRENTAIQVAKDWYYFSITDAVKYWLLTDEQKAARPDNFDIDKGIMLKAKNDTTMDYQYKAFGSYNNATYRPKIEIIYNSSANVSKPFGWLDGVTQRSATGWAWCFDYPNSALKCAALLHNETYKYEDIVVGLAGDNRADVSLAGYGTGAYGFSIPMNWNTRPVGVYRVEVEAWDVNNHSGYILPQSPMYYINEGVMLSKPSATMYDDETLQLTALVVQKEGGSGKVTWKSSNTSIATVSSSGKVTPKATGTVTITATPESGRSDTCVITVKQSDIDGDYPNFHEDKAYWIRSVDTKQYLTVMNGEWKSGSSIGVTTYTGSTESSYAENIMHPHMYWKIIEYSDGEFTLTPYNSLEMNMSVGVSNTDPTNVELYPAPEDYVDPPAESIWRIVENEDGTLTIASKDSGFMNALGVISNDVAVVDRENATKWEIVKADCPSIFGGDEYAYGHVLDSVEVVDEKFNKIHHFTRYRCSVCYQEYKSPEEQDIDALAPQHYIAVLHLQRAYMVNIIAGELQKADATMRVINYIRGAYGRNYGENGYDFIRRYTGSSGVEEYRFVSGYKYLWDDYDFHIEVSINDTTDAIINHILIDLMAMIPGPVGYFYSGVGIICGMLEKENVIVDTVETAISVGMDILDDNEKFNRFMAIHPRTNMGYKVFGGIFNTLSVISNAWEVCGIYNEILGLKTYNYFGTIKYVEVDEYLAFYSDYNFDSVSQIDINENNGGISYNDTMSSSDQNYGSFSYRHPQTTGSMSWKDLSINY